MGFFDFIHERRNNMQLWAHDMQMTFNENDVYGISAAVQDFELMQSGSQRKMKYLMSGGHELDNFEECIFDYHYTTGSSDHEHTVRTSVIFLNSKNILLPTFFARPKNKLGKWFARIRNKNQGENLKDQFLYNYKIKMEADTTLDFLIDSGVPDLLLTDKIYHIEGNGHYLILYRDGQILSLQQLLNMRTTAYNIFDYFKSESWLV